VPRSVDRDDEKTMGMKPVPVTPLDLLPLVLVNGGEEGRTTVNCFEFDVRVSGLSVVLSSVPAKKMKEMNGSSIIYWLKMFIGLSRLVMVWVRGYLGRLVMSGFNHNGFRPKIVSKKPIIHLKPVCKSSGLFFKASLRSKVTRCGPLVLAGTRGASDEISSLEILTEEGFGSDSVSGSELGLSEVGFEMFSKDHQLGNVVLVSIARDGLVPVSSGPSLSASLLAQDSASASLEASLKPEGSSSAPVHLFSGGFSSGAAEV